MIQVIPYTGLEGEGWHTSPIINKDITVLIYRGITELSFDISKKNVIELQKMDCCDHVNTSLQSRRGVCWRAKL